MYPQTARKVLAKLKYPVPEQECKPAVSLADAGLAALGTRGKDPRQREGLVLQRPDCLRQPSHFATLLAVSE